MGDTQLFDFMSSQRLLALATNDGEESRVSNVFYGIDSDWKIYFVSPTSTLHSTHIQKNPKIAFTSTWFDSGNHQDRKSVQGKGISRIATSQEEIEMGVHLHNVYYPEFAEKITIDRVKSSDNEGKVRVIEPTYIKFWNDELYGLNGVKEFNF